MTLSMLQLLVAFFHVSDELRFEAFKFTDFPTHLLQLCFQQVPHRFAGFDLAHAKDTQLPDFSQRETQAVHLPHEAQPLDVID